MTRVLVVDDEPQMLRALRINLKARNYLVVTAADGDTALRLAARTPPEAVILDLGLPDLDGVEVIRALRIWSKVPIIVLSGRSGAAEKVAALDSLSGFEGEPVSARGLESAPEVLADPPLLERVLANLIANGVRHTPAGTPVLLTASAHGDRVELRVIDRGQGLPPEDRDRIFQPFQRLGDTDNGTGVGLGLALSRGLAEAMGGTLDPEDTPGGGLTMVLSLPAAPHDQNTQAQPLNGGHAQGDGSRNPFPEYSAALDHATAPEGTVR